MSVRRWLVVALAATLLGVGSARAGTIQGHVKHASKPAAVAGLVVQAIGIDASEKTIERETRADASGHYAFENLPTPAAYLVRARYGDLVFPGGSAVFRPGEPEIDHTLDFQVYDSTSDASRLRIVSLQWVIGRSAGVWRVNQSAGITNPDPAVVVVGPDAPPILRIALAPGHGDVETLFGRLPDGVVIRDGVAEIRGPVLPGKDGLSLQFAYDLTAPDDQLETVIELPDAVDEFGVFLQDFGIDVDAGALHPARPTRENDVIYQSFLGFELPAGSVLPLRVRVLPPLFPLPQAVIAGVAALLAAALLYFVAGPLAFPSRRAGALALEAPEASPAKAALAAALFDLEHDFDTGKLSPDDRDRLRDDLRREALGALARERGQLEPAPAPIVARTAAARVCVCGREARDDDRFCAGCGKAL